MITQVSKGISQHYQMKNVKIKYVYAQGWTKINKRGGPNKGV